jgi:acylphosphatase
MNDNVQAHVIIQGRVQGVFFRVETRKAASRYGVAGWVRNLPDGTVEAVFEGTRQQVEQVIDWCRKGPPLGRVDGVDVKWESAAGKFNDFSIT